MKKISLNFFWLLTPFYLGIPQVHAQEKPINYSLALNSALADRNTLPFWMTANKFGAIQNRNQTAVNAALFSDFKNYWRDFSFSYKANFTGYLSSKNDFYVNELYGSIKFKGAQLDLGSKNDEIIWEGLSSSNGNIIKSTNTRAIPGINLKTNDFLTLPFAENWLRVKANYAEYFLNDKRAVDGAHLHHKSLHFKSVLGEKTSMITGINHYVQWGGTSNKFGEQPSSFKDYLRIISGKAGGSDALETDRLNVLGNHLGSYLIQLNYLGTKTNWNFYYSHPFEDRSGLEMQNWRDGIYGFFIDFKKPKAFLTHFLAEFTYTKNMSGDSQHKIAEDGSPIMARGRDNYFNNGVYSSGWTYFGNTIGSPYFTPETPDRNGITQGVANGDNRFMAINIGVKGFLKEIQYKALFSHITYFGWFDNEYDPKPTQFSGYLEVNLTKTLHLPFEIVLGSAFDIGSQRPNNIGGFFKLTKNINN